MLKGLLYNVYIQHKNFWVKDNFSLLLQGILIFGLALIVQRYAYDYVDNRVNGTHVGDLLLDNLPIVNLDFFIVEGAIISTLIVIFFLITNPKYILFAIKTLALFIIVRSFFISLTHLGTNLHQITLNANSIGFSIYDFLYNSKNDFFFSGHVGASFLFALIFWKEILYRNLFIVISIIFGVSMVLAKMHYSIDIFAAPFIVYGIYEISKRLFQKDFKLIRP